jgi:hypothetical protein
MSNICMFCDERRYCPFSLGKRLTCSFDKTSVSWSYHG